MTHGRIQAVSRFCYNAFKNCVTIQRKRLSKILQPSDWIYSRAVLTFRDEKVKVNQGLITPRQAGGGIDDLTML